MNYPRSGDTLTLNRGRYKLETCIGRGGQGHVWKAQCEGAWFAVKVPLVANGAERFTDTHIEQNIQRSQAEIEFLRRLGPKAEQAFIAPCVDFGSLESPVGRLPVLVTPYYPKRLEDYLPLPGSGRAALPAWQRFQWIMQIIKALRKTHNELRDQTSVYVHRDLKTANLLLTANLEIRLIDFGIVHEARPVYTQSHVYSYHAAAPEQLLAKDWRDNRPQYAIGPHCDLYALGIVIYRLFTGTWPAVQSQLVERIAEHARLCGAGGTGLLGQLGGLNSDERRQLAQQVSASLQYLGWAAERVTRLAEGVAAFTDRLLHADAEQRPSAEQAYQWIAPICLDLQPDVTFVDHTEPASAVAPKVESVAELAGNHRRPLIGSLVLALTIVLGLVIWQAWPAVHAYWQLSKWEAALNGADEAAQREAWQELNRMVAQEQSEEASTLLKNFEIQTQALLDSGQALELQRAVPRLRLSAENGDQNAMLWMAALSIKGSGMPKSWAEAERWYQKAASFNNPVAKERLLRLAEARQREPFQP